MADKAKTPELGVPAGRFLQISLTTNKPGPYVITDKISVAPPTKARTEQMAEAQARTVIYNGLLSEALKGGAPKDALMELSQGARDAEQDYNRAFLGDAYENVLLFFADRDINEWTAFVADIKEHFEPSQPADDLAGDEGK